MLDRVFPGLETAKDKHQYLVNNADAIEEKEYSRLLTTEELNEIKETIANETIKIEALQDEKKQMTAELNESIKSHKGMRSRMLDKFKSKHEDTKAPCYRVLDMDSRMVGWYDEDGILVDQRPARAEELSPTIFSLQREGTNDY